MSTNPVKYNNYNKSNIEVIEQTIRCHMNDNGNAYEAIVGLYNALAFGDVLIDNGFEFDDADFTPMMNCLSEAAEFAKRFVKRK